MDRYELEFKGSTIQPFGGPAMENLSNTKAYVTNGNKTYISFWLLVLPPHV